MILGDKVSVVVQERLHCPGTAGTVSGQANRMAGLFYSFIIRYLLPYQKPCSELMLHSPPSQGSLRTDTC